MNVGKTTKTLTTVDSSCAAGKHCAMAEVTAMAGLLCGFFYPIGKLLRVGVHPLNALGEKP
jgi:hypothetical protein